MIRPLLGRDTELARMRELFERIDTAGTAIVMLGEPGIGKSALIQTVRFEAEDYGLEVLSTAGVEAEAELPYAGLHQLLGSLLDVVASFPGVQGDSLRCALGLDEGPPPEPFLVSLATLNLLTDRAARQPIVALVDDLHWLDPQTQVTLGFVARRISLDPIIILAAARVGYPIAAATEGMTGMELGGLHDDAALELLGATSTDLDARDLTRIVREARGNPLALLELPKTWPVSTGAGEDMLPSILPVTSTLERAFAGRASLLPPLTRDALLLAAVDGSDDLGEVIAAASHLSATPITARALQPAIDAGLISVDSAHIVFRHPLVRSALLQSEPIHRIHAANAAVAGVLPDDVYRRAWHRAQSIVGPDDEIASELEASAAVPLRRGAVTSAILCLERSAQLTSGSLQRGHRYLLAAEHAFGLGQTELVERLLRTASRESLSQLDRYRMEWLREIHTDGVPGDPGKVMSLCSSAREASRGGDDDLALNLLLAAALRCWWADTGPTARHTVVTELEDLPRARGDARYLAILGVAEPVLRGAAVIEALEQIVIEEITDADHLRLLGMAAHAVGDSPLASDFLDRAETRLRSQGRLGLIPHVLNMAVPVRLIIGDWGRAATATEEGRRLAHETGQPIWEAGAVTGDARASGLRGDLARALRLASEAEEASAPMRLNSFLACVQLARGFAWAAEQRYEEAYRELRRLYDPNDPAYHQRELYAGVMHLAEAAIHVSKAAEAREVLAHLEAVAQVTPAPDLHVNLLYARAVLADDSSAEAAFESALAHNLVRWPWIRARIELAYGQWLRRQRRVTDSRLLLRSALATLEIVGAPTWADQARAELRAAGERVDAEAFEPQSVLSPQELQIARLAAEGLSNREIGNELYISPRTVSSHLYHIFPKLNITSRSQLAGRLLSPPSEGP